MDFNIGILILEMHGTNIKKKKAIGLFHTGVTRIFPNCLVTQQKIHTDLLRLTEKEWNNTVVIVTKLQARARNHGSILGMWKHF